MKYQLTITAVALGLFASPGVFAGGHDNPQSANDHSQHQQHMMHNVSPEQMKALRERIPVYDAFSDEQIMGFMMKMDNTNGWMTSGERRWVIPGTEKGDVGILALAHGFKEPGNTQFRAAFQNVAAEIPSTYALGMAMMSSDNIATAIKRLEDAGAKKIVIMPVTTADNSSLTRQWDYIFGKIKDPAYLDADIITSAAQLIWTPTPSASPIISDIMLAYAKEISLDPANEVVFVLGHGPQSKEDNDKELAILKKHGDYIKQRGGFAEVYEYNVQDDAPPDVRSANVAAIRAQANAAAEKGFRVIAVTNQLTRSSVVGRLRNDIGPIATFNPHGLMEHPLFETWITEQVEIALKEK